MKVADFYNRTPIKVEKELWQLINGWYSHIPEVEDSEIDCKKSNTRIEVRIYHDPYIDGERCCTIGAAYFDDKPVMLFRHGGRGGHDDYDEFVTDGALYWQMVKYIKEELRRDDCEPSGPRQVDPNEEVESLDCFYNCVFPEDFGMERFKGYKD